MREEYEVSQGNFTHIRVDLVCLLIQAHGEAHGYALAWLTMHAFPCLKLMLV